MLRVRQIKIEVTKDSRESIAKSISKKLRTPLNFVEDFNVIKKSVDARNKNEIYYVYELDVSIKNEGEILKKINSPDVFESPDMEYRFEKTGTKTHKNPPVIVGSGPAGLFAAYILAENGYAPVIIERGEDMQNRRKTVEKFWTDGILNAESNVQFGEGGAGTFSDGKLNTLVKDTGNRCHKVLETFVRFGAPDNILYEQKPHIGTDLLCDVIVNMREAIKTMGGKFMYNTCLTSVEIENNCVKGIVVNNGERIECETLVLAIGHSARDTFRMLFDLGFSMSAKPFAVGVRVQHNQDMINLSQYGHKYKDVLPEASYKLTYKAKNGRGVYSFCMCPGGYVVNASSEKGRLAINGMSYNDRDSGIANSAIIATVTPDDFGNHPLDGVEFQRKLETAAYNVCNGKIPVQLLKDFKNNHITEKLGTITPKFKGEWDFADLNGIFPEVITESLKESFDWFGRKIKGFDADDTVISAVESRTSSPVRIERDENGESSVGGVYPCGEGAGYAGGITSAAMDGIRVAEKIGAKYKA